MSSKWLGGDDTPADDTPPENPAKKWFAETPSDTNTTQEDGENSKDTAETTPTPESTITSIPVSSSSPTPPAPQSSASSWLTAPQPTTTDDDNPGSKGKAKTKGTKKRKAKAGAKPKKSAKDSTRPAAKAKKSTRPARISRPRRTVPRWAKITGIAVLAVGIIGTAAKLGADNFGGTDDPILAGGSASSQMREPSEAPYAPRESATPTNGWGERGNLPNDSTPVVSGQCEPREGEERIGPSTKSLRTAVAAFYDEYRAHNAEGIGATLDEKSSMKKQNWAGVFDQLDPDASWCIRMGPDHGNKVDLQVRMNVNGKDTVFEQTATGVSRDGQFKIQELEER